MDKLIEEWPDDTSTVDMDEGLNNEYDDKKEITAENEDESVIQIDITEN